MLAQGVVDHGDLAARLVGVDFDIVTDAVCRNRPITAFAVSHFCAMMPASMP